MMTLPFGWNMNKLLLVFLNTLAGVVLIALSFTSALPLDPINFIFFSFVGLLFALYRPGWTFLFLIGMLPYEIISFAPESLGIMIRPYQWLLVLLTLALFIRFLFKRFPLPHFTPSKWDGLVMLLGVGSLFSALASTDQATAFPLSVILSSFILLYFVCRLFVRGRDDIAMIFPFLLSSFLVVACYAVLQNILFLGGRESLEVMAGRPNATFAEADWLGGYLAMMIVFISSLIATPNVVRKYFPVRHVRCILSLFLFFGFLALILSVSRSAWLAAFLGIFSVIFLASIQSGLFRALRNWKGEIVREAFSLRLHILLPFLLALLFVQIFALSPFDLLDRSKSVASGDQKVTVSCERPVTLPEKIDSLEMLKNYDCEHIRLEDIKEEELSGAYVTEVFRSDPNVNIRLSIYERVSHILKERFISGIGFGVISEHLGTDERGAGLNASNVFLEVWLGAGLIGFLAFISFWFGLGMRLLYRGFRNRSSYGLILGSVFVSVTVFNLFNSGLLLGWFFLCMALLLVPETDPSQTPETSEQKSL